MKALAIPGLTTDDDLRWLAEHARDRPIIIELGPYKGRSTRALADANGGTVYAIDNWNAALNGGRSDKTARAACQANLADLIRSQRVVLIKHDSRKGAPPQLAGVVADMLWIDADHAYASVLSDIDTYAPFVRPGGLVCGHDYNAHHPEVMRAVDERFGARVRTIGPKRSIWWIA